jgi:sugar (pentulose or hexulose) kinase
MSVGHFSSIHAAVNAWVQVARAYEPDMKMHDMYEEKYRNYLKLYPALKNARIAF